MTVIDETRTAIAANLHLTSDAIIESVIRKTEIYDACEHCRENATFTIGDADRDQLKKEITLLILTLIDNLEEVCKKADMIPPKDMEEICSELIECPLSSQSTPSASQSSVGSSTK